MISTENIVKILLVLGILCSLISVLLCRDLTNYLIIILLFSTFVCILKSTKKFNVPLELFLIISASFLYFCLAIVSEISISFGITILLYSFLITTLSIISYQIDLADVINRAFPIILILILLEYIFLVMLGSSVLQKLSCNNEALSLQYRVIHNITSSALGISYVSGLNSIFLGAQSASLFLVLSIFWFFRKARENANSKDYLFFVISTILLILSPTVTGAILFLIGCILYIFLFNIDRKISYKTVSIVFSLTIISLVFIYFYIDAQHNFYYLISDTLFATFNKFSDFHFSQIISGVGPAYTGYLVSNEIALIALMLMYGIVGFTIFLFLFILLPLNIGINLERSDRIYILMILLLFISLIHYNASIRGGFLFLYISFLSIVFGKWVNRFNT